jgi:hypothetical protein
LKREKNRYPNPNLKKGCMGGRGAYQWAYLISAITVALTTCGE